MISYERSKGKPMIYNNFREYDPWRHKRHCRIKSLVIAITLILISLLAPQVFAQWSDTSRSNLSVLTSGDRGSQTNAVAGVLHIDAVNNLDALCGCLRLAC